MKKKITAFFVACFIFSYSLLYCFYCPVYATVPAEVDFPLLNDAMATLFFMCGLDSSPYFADTMVTQQDIYEMMDADTRAIFDQRDAETAARLKSQFDDFIDSVKRGYGIAFHLNNEMYQALQDYAYTNDIAPNGITKNAPGMMNTWLASQTGNIILIKNKANSNGFTYEYINAGSYPLVTPVLYSSNPNAPLTKYSFRFTNVYSSDIRYTVCNVGDYGTSLNVYTIDWLKCVQEWFADTTVEYAYIYNHTSAYTNNSLIDSYITSGQYTGIIDGVYGTDTDGNVIIDSTGELPNVIGRATIGGYTDSITDGDTTWGAVIGSFATSTPAEPSIPADGALTLDQLDALIDGLQLDRLNTKFPFCIPHDIQLIYSGASSVSSNAPVITIPLHIEFAGHVYYDNDECVTIDFNRFNPIISIFREGFFLLFLVGMIWLSIQIMQAFFVVTE